MATFTQALTAGVTPSGTLTQQVARALAGTGGSTGVLTRFSTHAFGGAVSPTGVLTRRATHAFGGTVTPTGLASLAYHRALTAPSTPLGSLILTRIPATPQTLVDVLVDSNGVVLPYGTIVAVSHLSSGRMLRTVSPYEVLVPGEVKATADGAGNFTLTLLSPMDMTPPTPYVLTVRDRYGVFVAQYVTTIWASTGTSMPLSYVLVPRVDPTRIPFYFSATNSDGTPAQGVPLTVQLNANSFVAGYKGIVSGDKVQTVTTDATGIARGSLTKSSVLDPHRWYIVTLNGEHPTLLRNAPDTGAFDILDAAYSNPGT